jgi:hypothetical protein
MTRIAAAVTGLCVLAALPAAAQVKAGAEFPVNTYTTDNQAGARVAMEPDGDFVVAWMSLGQESSGGYSVFGQRYAATGTPRGGEFRINSVTAGQNKNPSLAVGPAGDFTVTWDRSVALVNSIQGQRFGPTGSPVGGEFMVSTYTTTYNQFQPRVARGGDGRFVVSWWSGTIDGGLDGIAARLFDAAATPAGPEFLVNTYTPFAQRASDVAMAKDGSFVAVWEDQAPGRDGSESGIFGQRHDSAGNRLGAEFQVNTYTTGYQRFPSVSISPTGGFVVVWSSDEGDGDGHAMFGRRYDAAGSPIGGDFVINTSTSGDQVGYQSQVAHDAQGNFVVAWDGEAATYDRGIFAQRFTASGARRGAEFIVNTYTTDYQVEAAIASDDVGNFVVVWHGDNQDGSGRGVYGQRFGGLLPAALVVDGNPGNGVLEPGETVTVRPAWRNTVGAAQAFTGTLGGITGPAGATYAITDGTASYGTVADGALGSCTDCYAVSVSNPPTRPSVHWDASVLESLLPDTQGQQKRWLLHVGGSFTDVPSTSPFNRFIEALLHYGVTGGCSATAYCPSTPTTREQMAVFVLAARDGTGFVPPACTTPMFPDVPASSPFCRWIEELARRGVVGGCGGGSYCPSSEVTREQMAVFVLRTLDGALTPPPCTVPLYDDVPASSGFCRWIEELTRRGVVSGCGGQSYCPAGPVTREQMGVFIGVTFGLTLYGP